MAGLAELVCPDCGFVAGIEVFAGFHEARLFADLMGDVPPVLKSGVFRYLGLFAPPKRRLTFPRCVVVAKPLVQAIKAGRITVFKRELVVSLEQFEAALNTMHEKRADLGQLKSHAYLHKVIAGQLEKLEARAEAEDMAQLRTGKRAAEPDPLSAAGWDAERKQQHEISKALALSIGAMKSAQKLGVPHTAQTLAAELMAGGTSRDAAEFVAGKLFKPKT